MRLRDPSAPPEARERRSPRCVVHATAHATILNCTRGPSVPGPQSASATIGVAMFARAVPQSTRPRSSERPASGSWLLLAVGAALRAAIALWPALSASSGAASPSWRMALLFAGLSACAPLLVMALGRALFGAAVGFLAGWICALDPLLVMAPAPASNAAVALALALALTAAWVVAPRLGRALGVGLAWGIGALADPGTLPVLALMVPWAWVPLGLIVPPRDRARQFGFAALGLVAVIVPWTVRNTLVRHAFVPVWGPTGNPLSALPELGTIGRRLLAFLALPGDPLRTAVALALLPLWLWGVARAIVGPRRWFQSLALVPIVCFAAQAVTLEAPLAARVPVEPLIGLFAALGFHDLSLRFRARAHGLEVIEGYR